MLTTSILFPSGRTIVDVKNAFVNLKVSPSFDIEKQRLTSAYEEVNFSFDTLEFHTNKRYINWLTSLFSGPIKEALSEKIQQQIEDKIPRILQGISQVQFSIPNSGDYYTEFVRLWNWRR